MFNQRFVPPHETALQEIAFLSFSFIVSCPSLLELFFTIYARYKIKQPHFLNLKSHYLEAVIPPMRFHNFVFALFVSHWSLLLAQQPCYWPDGSGIAPNQGYWVNCYSSQNRTCCKSGEVCLSNGSCYGSEIGQVSLLHPHFYLGLPFARRLERAKN